jgi:glycosyltransferase involved in cell wall biosynthesis
VRILHVSDCFMPRMGGIEQQVHELAERQLAAGHDVEIVTIVGAQSGLTAADTVGTVGTDHVYEGSLRVHRPAVSRGKPGTIQYANWPVGGRTVRAGDYDAVHIHSSTWSPLAGLTMGTAARAGVPIVVTVHSLWNRYWPLFSAANRVFSWNSYPIVWTAVSSVAAVPLATHLRHGGSGGRHSPIEILPNAVDTSAWQIEPLPRDKSRVVIVSVMRLAQRKRPHQYVEMLRKARELVPPSITLEAVIIGDGPRRAGIERYLAKHKMTDWVTLYGRATHEQIREVYRDADFFVAPATLESFGIAALEARSSGLPIIAHAGSGVRDFIAHGREGLLAAGDTDMAERIAQLAMSPRLRAEMTRYNREHTPHFNWPDVLEQCEQLYRRAGYRPPVIADGIEPDELAQKTA